MRFLETSHERNSAKITTLLMLILVLLLFVTGPPYMDPPVEYGVAVNFGTSNVGSGNIQPTANNNSEVSPAESEPTEPEVQETIAPAVTEASSSEAPQENTDEVVATQDLEDAPVIEKKEDKPSAEAIEKQKQLEQERLEQQRIAEQKKIEEQKRKEAEALALKKKQEEEKKKKQLDALMGGVSSASSNSSQGEGDDTSSGDKGQKDGNPYAASYFGAAGNGNGGMGYGLNGRGAPTKQIFKQECNEYGLVVVKIVVNRSGKVIAATPGVKGTTNNASCLLEPAKKIALSHKWPQDNDAPERQIGFVSINFNQNN